jgi:SRSO17 transposase
MVTDHCVEDNNVRLSKEKEKETYKKKCYLAKNILQNNREIMIHASQILPQSQYGTQKSKYQVITKI